MNRIRTRAASVALAALGIAFGAVAQGTAGTPAAGDSRSPATASSSAKSSNDAKGQLNQADRQFIEMAASGGWLEVQAGEMAQQLAASEQVKKFAARMVADHGKTNAQLKELATAKGISSPIEPQEKHKQEVEKLQKLKGVEFDRVYMSLMVADHKENVQAFRKQAQSGQDAELKKLASATLPVLEEHLKRAQTVEATVKGGGKPSSDKGTTK